MTLFIILDTLLVILLGVTIGFAVIVNRKLDVFRTAHADLEGLSAAFAESSARTEEGLSRLKVAARTTEDDRQRTEKLTDDLRYLIERGDTLADRLEVAVKTARASERPTERPSERNAEPGGERPAPRRAQPALKTAERWSERGETELQPRSQAERQLLDALRATGFAGAAVAGSGPGGR